MCMVYGCACVCVRVELFTCEFRTQQRDDDGNDSVERGSVRRSRTVAVGVAPAFACVIECLYIIDVVYTKHTHTHECTPAVYEQKIYTHSRYRNIYVYMTKNRSIREWSEIVRG